MSLAWVLLILFAVRGPAHALYTLKPADRQFVLLLSGREIEIVGDRYLVIKAGDRSLKIPLSLIHMTHHIYSDAICCGDPKGPGARRIKEVKGQLAEGAAELFLVQVSAYRSSSSGSRRRGWLCVTYIKDFVSSRDFKRYCVDKVYYDRIALSKKVFAGGDEFEKWLADASARDMRELFKTYEDLVPQGKQMPEEVTHETE